MIKILLAADFHLGIEEDVSQIPVNLRIATFKRILFLASSHDICLIAGDFFDNFNIDGKIIDIVASEFNKIQKNGVKIIYTLGEKELNENWEAPSFLSRLNVTHHFSSLEDSHPYSFSKDGQKIFVYGLPASNKADVSKINKVDEDGFHIGLFHADFQFQKGNEDSVVTRLKRDDIKSLNLDFYALGHHHQFKLFKSLGRIIGAYPGSPEATSYSESGDRYVLSLVIKDNEIYQIKRLTVNSARLKETVIDCTELTDSNTILEEVINNASAQAIHKIVLKGRRNFLLDSRAIDKFSKVYLKLNIEDLSMPTIDVLINKYRNEDSLRGEFFGVLDEKIKNGMLKDIDISELSDILNQIIVTGFYSSEEFLCKYKNV